MSPHEIQERWDAAARAGDDAAFVALVCNDVLDYPREALDCSLTPFATIRDLMGGGPPLFWGRERWRNRLLERVAREITQQRAFVREQSNAFARIRTLKARLKALK